MAVTTRVTRRLQEAPAPDKLSTSEYFQQIFETPGRPKAKVRQCQRSVFAKSLQGDRRDDVIVDLKSCIYACLVSVGQARVCFIADPGSH